MRISPASILSYAQLGLLLLLVPGPGVLAALTRRRQLGASSVIGYAAVKSDETPYIFGRLAATDDKGATPRHHTTRKNQRRKRNLQMSISTTAATPNPPPPTPPATEAAQPATTVPPPPTPPATTTVTPPPPTPPAPTPCLERVWYCAGESGDGGCTNSGDPPDGATTFASAEDCCESEQCSGSDYFDICQEETSYFTCPHAADAADQQQQTIINVFNDDPDTEV